jgi:hypothetical protein
MDQQERHARTREIAREVLLEAFGASATPFVPVPFVDDWVLARILRRIAGKVLAKHGHTSPALVRGIVDAYVGAGATPLGTSVLVGAARFVVRKVAVVLDVKKSHDVFGESIAFALALDLAASDGAVTEPRAAAVGAALHRTLQTVGSGTVEALVRAAREAFTRGQMKEMGEAIGREVEKTRDQLEPILQQELARTAPGT